MIDLTYSNRTEALLSALARRLAARREAVVAGQVDPLTPVWIVVPNRNVERHVELELARALGIAANLRFLRLQDLVRGWLGERLLLDDALVARTLGGLLDRALLDEPVMAPVHRYLAAAGGDPEATDLRRAQLAVHVARLFEEYAYSRPELLDRHRGVLREILTAPEALFFPRYQHEHHGALGRGPEGRHGFGHLDDRDGTRGVVVRTVENGVSVFVRGSHPDVIHVARKDDVLVLELGITPVQDRHDVGCRRGLLAHGHIEAEGPGKRAMGGGPVGAE